MRHEAVVPVFSFSPVENNPNSSSNCDFLHGARMNEGNPATSPSVVAPPQVSSEKYLSFTTLSRRPKFVFFGDSITEQGSTDPSGWVASLSVRYARRADIINRGLNGYNSRWGRAALPLVLQEVFGDEADGERAESPKKKRKKEEAESAIEPKSLTPSSPDLDVNDNVTLNTDLFVVAFGANDSCLSDGKCSRHHVPLEEYGSNLADMVHSILKVKPKSMVALATPPPCDTFRQQNKRKNIGVTARYTEKCQKVAKDLGVTCIDWWNGLQKRAGEGINAAELTVDWSKEFDWRNEYLSDGLHLTSQGNRRLFDLVLEALERPRSEGGLGLAAVDIPRQYPDHNMVDSENPGATFGTS